MDQEERKILDEYREHLEKKGLPVIYGTDHLSSLIGIKLDVLKSMIFGTHKFYRVYDIPKRTYGYREIASPFPALLEVQRWIASNILHKLHTHEAAHGYVVGRSIISNAEPHCGARNLLKMDISDFFPSILESRIIGFYRRLGYTSSVSLALGKLCSLNRSAPQGAGTSPVLSNVIFFNLDKRLTKASCSLGFTYTRYADDLTFSGENIPIKFVEYVESIVESGGFLVNARKTKLYKNPGRRIVTGVSVSSDFPRLPKPTKRRWRAEVTSLLKLGVEEHCARIGVSQVGYLAKINGKLSHWHCIEPENKFVLNHWPRIKSAMGANPLTSGKFEIYKDKYGDFRFSLKLGNGKVILTSEGYTSLSCCKDGIEYVKSNAKDRGRYEKKETDSGEFIFSMMDANRQIIGISVSYETLAAREQGMKSVMEFALNAKVYSLV